MTPKTHINILLTTTQSRDNPPNLFLLICVFSSSGSLLLHFSHISTSNHRLHRDGVWETLISFYSCWCSLLGPLVRQPPPANPFSERSEPLTSPCSPPTAFSSHTPPSHITQPTDHPASSFPCPPNRKKKKTAFFERQKQRFWAIRMDPQNLNQVAPNKCLTWLVVVL